MSFSIVPHQVASFGCIFNCAKKSATMEALTCATDDQFLVIFRAKRDIREGEELTYSYNADMQEYKTKDFTDL